MAEEAIDKFGRIDILVNNAAISTGRGFGALLNLEEEEFDLVFGTNVKGVLFCTQAVLPHLMKKHYEKIINISSLAGLGTSVATTNLFYASSKAAINILTKRLAFELGSYGICVNAIAPGLIRADISGGSFE